MKFIIRVHFNYFFSAFLLKFMQLSAQQLFGNTIEICNMWDCNLVLFTQAWINLFHCLTS